VDGEIVTSPVDIDVLPGWGIAVYEDTPGGLNDPCVVFLTA